MQSSTYKTETMEQVTYTHPSFPGASALATRFAGSRRWSVVGFGNSGYTVHCTNGQSESFSKSDAARMAELFVTRGRDFL